jgi:hypothetical protein
MIAQFGSNVQLVNLPSGSATTLIRFQPNNSSATIQQIGLNVDRTIVRYFVTHGVVNGKPIAAWAIVSVQLSNKATSVKQMPDFQEGNFYLARTAVSPQGRFFAFQGRSLHSQGRSVVTTQLGDLVTGAKFALADISVEAFQGLGFSFSPDGAALAVHGCRYIALSTTEVACKVLVFATTDGRLIASMDASLFNPSGGRHDPTLELVGWFGKHSLAYVSLPQWGGAIPHALDVLTGKSQDLPAELGNLVAVLT